VGPVPSYQNVCNSRSFDQLLTNITTVTKASPLITCAYVAPLDASLQAEADRRKQSSSPSDAKLYAEAAAAATTTTATSSDTTRDAGRGGGGGPRKRRRQRQKEKRARRLHSKYLRASPTTDVTTGSTNTSSTPSPTTRDIHASAETTNPTSTMGNASTTPPTGPAAETPNLIEVAT
jgi:hypothetical protein